MKKIMQFLSIVLMGIIQGCTGQEPTRDEIKGNWVTEEGGILRFNSDGTFMTKNLLGSMIFKYSNDYRGAVFTETGSWEIEKWQGQWVVSLGFRKSEVLKKGYATRVLISGSGILENNPPWNLFLWVDEEGGDRYIFKKE